MLETERAELEALIGHRFRAYSRLERALTHSSHKQEPGEREPAAADSEPGHNERLEFLGDAVLGLVVSEFLIARFPAWDEGKLSTAKARLVNARQLAAAAGRLHLGRYLKLGRGEEKTGVRENQSVLADAFEALLAAIYLDAGLPAAAEFVRRTLLETVTACQAEALEQPDHKSALQGFLQARGMPLAEYRHVREIGPDHRKTFVVEVWVQGKARSTAEASTKKEAEQAAAQLALDHLRSSEPTS